MTYYVRVVRLSRDYVVHLHHRASARGGGLEDSPEYSLGKGPAHLGILTVARKAGIGETLLATGGDGRGPKALDDQPDSQRQLPEKDRDDRDR